jgi:hypothetical protein
MANKRNHSVATDPTAALLRDLMIIQLGLAGIGQREIHAVVGGDKNRISRIVKNLKKKGNASQSS